MANKSKSEFNIVNSLMLSLLSIIGGSTLFLATQFISFIETNSKEHGLIVVKQTEIKGEAKALKDWTIEKYNEVILPNKKRSLANEKAILTIKTKFNVD